MKTELKMYKVSEIVEGFLYNEIEGKGLYGLGGKLVIQPEYQRNYIYADGKRDKIFIPLCVVKNIFQNMLTQRHKDTKTRRHEVLKSML
jgi:hypothetical protein